MRRQCSKTACSAPAVATMTYVYADSMAVLGPLAVRDEPGSYDLCAVHASTMKAPKGWELLRISEVADEPPAPDSDDLDALAETIRRIGFADDPAEHAPAHGEPTGGTVVELARRGHLRVIADASQSG